MTRHTVYGEVKLKDEAREYICGVCGERINSCPMVRLEQSVASK